MLKRSARIVIWLAARRLAVEHPVERRATDAELVGDHLRPDPVVGGSWFSTWPPGLGVQRESEQLGTESSQPARCAIPARFAAPPLLRGRATLPRDTVGLECGLSDVNGTRQGESGRAERATASRLPAPPSGLNGPPSPTLSQRSRTVFLTT
jgi:hypothetical protein